MEKRRISVENDTIELNFLETIKRLKLTDDNVLFRIAMLEVNIALDFSGEEWDDDYNSENGGDA